MNDVIRFIALVYTFYKTAQSVLASLIYITTFGQTNFNRHSTNIRHRFLKFYLNKK